MMTAGTIAALEDIKARNSERKSLLSGVPAPVIEPHEDIALLAAALEEVLYRISERDKWHETSLVIAENALLASDSAEDREAASRMQSIAKLKLQDSREIVDIIKDVLGRSRRSVEITVPSGRLIAADDLRSVPHFDVEDIYDKYGRMDMVAWTESVAKQTNSVYAFVGNSGPSVLRKPDGSLEVVSPAYGDDDEKVLYDGEVPVANICTDLWATMMTDYQHWLDQGGPAVETEGRWSKFTVIDVPAGRYRWTVYSHVPGFDIHAEGRLTYARLELIEAY